METYQTAFIEFCLAQNVLRFGDFTLKSGRQSPYFFNAGLFNSGSALLKLGQFYATAIQHAAINFDMLFGPAYKGIPIAVSTAIALAEHYQRDVPYAFNRKEIKDHGEGGNIIGHRLQGKILIVDDVITAGTAFREAFKLLQDHQTQPAGLVIAMDRQERGQGSLSAIQEIEQIYHIPVISIIKFEHLLSYIATNIHYNKYLDNLMQYRNNFGSKQIK